MENSININNEEEYDRNIELLNKKANTYNSMINILETCDNQCKLEIEDNKILENGLKSLEQRKQQKNNYLMNYISHSKYKSQILPYNIDNIECYKNCVVKAKLSSLLTEKVHDEYLKESFKNL